MSEIIEADEGGIPMHCLSDGNIDVIHQIAAARDWEHVEEMAGRFK